MKSKQLCQQRKKWNHNAQLFASDYNSTRPYVCACFEYFDWIDCICVCVSKCVFMYKYICICVYAYIHIHTRVSTLHILIDTVEIANLFNIWFQKNPSLSDDIQMANWFDAQELTKYNWISHFCCQIGKSFICIIYVCGLSADV